MSLVAQQLPPGFHPTRGHALLQSPAAPESATQEWDPRSSRVAQGLANPTRNHGAAGSIPGLPQWAGDPALP